MDDSSTSKWRLWLRRSGWLVGIWAASIAALAVLAYILRLIMSAIGMTR